MVDLASLEPETDKLYIVKLKNTSVDLSQLNDVVKNEVVRKDVYGKLIKNF